MPTYNYRCNNKNCLGYSIVKEVIHKMNDPKPLCEGCKTEYEKVHLSVPLVQYKGKWFKNSGEY